VIHNNSPEESNALYKNWGEKNAEWLPGDEGRHATSSRCHFMAEASAHQSHLLLLPWNTQLLLTTAAPQATVES
jgi:hypothetical protein